MFHVVGNGAPECKGRQKTFPAGGQISRGEKWQTREKTWLLLVASAVDETRQGAGHGPGGSAKAGGAQGHPRGWWGRARSRGGPEQAVAQADLGHGPEAPELVWSPVGNLQVTWYWGAGGAGRLPGRLGPQQRGRVGPACLPPLTGGGDDPRSGGLSPAGCLRLP